MKKKRFQGQKLLYVVLNKEVREKAGGYAHVLKCPIATALHQQYERLPKTVVVSPTRVCLLNKDREITHRYDIVGDNGLPTLVMRNEDLCVLLEKST